MAEQQFNYLVFLAIFVAVWIALYTQGHDKVKKRHQEQRSEALSGYNESDAMTVKTFLELRRKLDDFETFKQNLDGSWTRTYWSVVGIVALSLAGGIVEPYLGIPPKEIAKALPSGIAFLSLVFFISFIELYYRTK